MSVQLIASAAGVRESATTHGHRHLLEHILAKGPDKAIDLRLESHGIFLTAETHRDAMVLALTGPTEKLDIAIETMKEFLQPLQTSAAEVERERRILAEEIALYGKATLLSQRLWMEVFAEDGYDPIGTPESWAKATPESLELLRRRHFAAQNLVLSISGPLDVDRATKLARSVLPAEKSPVEPDLRLRKTAKPLALASLAEASAKGVAAQGWNDPQCAALLAAALALAGERDNGFVIHTPSAGPGLVTAGDTEGGFAKWVDELSAGAIDAMFAFGRFAADRWVRRKLETPEGNSFLRGYLLCQNPAAEPERFLENVSAMTLADFRAAVAKYRRSAE